jgi:RNA polymerase sigma-70 factor (ECF subfamily)
MRAAIAGDERAYQILLKGLPHILRATVRHGFNRFHLPPADQEDIIQDILLTVHAQRHRWDASLPLFPWLFTITRNRIIDEFRRRNRRHAFDVVELAACDCVRANELDQPDVTAAYDAARVLSWLPDRNREIVASIMIGGLSARELAARLGMKETTVRVNLHRSLAALTEKFSGGVA